MLRIFNNIEGWWDLSKIFASYQSVIEKLQLSVQLQMKELLQNRLIPLDYHQIEVQLSVILRLKTIRKNSI